VHGGEIPLLLSLPNCRGASVLRLHGIAMARALLAPLPGATAREAHRDERRAQIVSAHTQAILGSRKQLGARDPRAREIFAQLGGQVIDVQARASVVDQNPRIRSR
jgi:hypothetical protein